ncbi:thiosulfate/3-mercaptopyruvate sulfurtransferase [Melaminivora alkalimesophila]|uniref:Thiosulfate/3-mercaptopyruvate sulfurtransferase n=2 Tax=Melaminivora alkalimesophila TaxID=1165852 RepID=A0A317RFD3_9BURK|nr:sulfurtransferase [Melaminivora alkalimesophila]PWW48798.1 thiosulfate/3-mercaptopyruvate sulfurtransferase [Melaminivora alkalimesophila]
MAYTLLISAPELQALMREHQRLMVFDCSFDLATPSRGAVLYREEHIPGAVHADLDQHLSARHGAPGPGGVLVAGAADAPCSGGRHPLPNRERFATWLSSVGFANDMQAVVYDRNGANYCGRLWWMLKWAGHDAVAVLDGGLQAWKAAGGAVASGDEPAHFQTNFRLGEPLRRLVGADEVHARLSGGGQVVIDARAAARYRGEVEPLDPVAGHIPGALNRPFGENLGPDGRFKPAAQLRAEFDALLAGRDPGSVVHQCGSGVSAIPNLLAMEIAGYPPTALFAGSWSEWCSDPTRPVERGG